MNISRFANNPDRNKLNTNGFARLGADAAKPVSFTERKRRESDRSLVRNYSSSRLGALTDRAPTSVSPATKPADANQLSAQPPSRQSFNAPGGHTFSEPPSRSYNPYA